MFKNSKQKARLAEYKDKIENVQIHFSFTIQVKKGKVIRSKELNEWQIDRLKLFRSRAIMYCTIQRPLHYLSEPRIKSKQMIATDEQLLNYCYLYNIFNLISREISEDDVLNKKNKRELNRNLGYLIGHLRGKLNKQSKYRKYYDLIKTYINNKYKT